MSKIIIIDLSFSSSQCYNDECSLGVAEAAQRAGLSPTILANWAFPRSLTPQSIELIPLFVVDWFDQPMENPQALRTVSPAVTVIQGHKLSHPLIQLFLEKVVGSTTRLRDWIRQDLALLRFVPGSNTLWGLGKIVWGMVRFTGKIIVKILQKLLAKSLNVSQPISQLLIDQPQRFIETWAEILP
ncbi:MAG: hypothetical protein ACKO5Q_13020, partial [Microcystaceae cyanobacterium]